VFTVDTNELLFEGGSRVFTLDVTGDKKDPKTVSVTLNITPNLTGAAVFRVDWATPPTTSYADLDLSTGAATLVRIGTLGYNNTMGAFTGFQEALEYVDRNAEANTDYLIRVEQDELSLPKFLVSLRKKNNITLRLRGTAKGGPKILQHGGSSEYSYNTSVVTQSSAKDCYGFFNFGKSGTSKETFVLENNITVKGIGKGQPDPNPARYSYLVHIWPNSTLVMKKGSKLTELTHTQVKSVILVTPTFDPATAPDGNMRIEGGSITDCTFLTSGWLVYMNYTPTYYDSGAFYMAASTEENPIDLTGNTSTKLVFNSNSSYTWDLLDYLGNGLSKP
jgi:hypothetical protein